MIIYGDMGKGGGSTPIEEDDSLSSKQTLRILHALSNGVIDSVEEVYVNRVKLEEVNITKRDIVNAESVIAAPSISGVIVDWRNGEDIQKIIPGFESVISPIDNFNISELQTGIPSIISIPSLYTRTRITLSIDRLMFIDEDGNIEKTTIEYKIAVGWNSETVSSATGSKYKKYGKASSATAFDILVHQPSVETSVAPPTWYIAVTRITPMPAEAVKQTTHNSIRIGAVTAIKDVALTYPGTALLGISFNKAKKYGNSMPDLIFKVSGIKVKVPSNTISSPPKTPAANYYNPITGTYGANWTLNMDDTVLYPSANPAWQLLYLLTDVTYGLGISEDKIDIGAYYELAKYCDEKLDTYVYGNDGNRVIPITQRRRYELHNQFNEREQAASFLAYFYSIALAKPTINRFGLHSVTWDRPRSPSILVGNSNVIDGLFTYSSNSIEERYTTVNAIYNDINDLGKVTTVTVPLGSDQATWYDVERDINSKYEKRSIDLPMIGCYNLEQAIVKARWFLYRNSVLTGIISFKVLLDGLNFEIGNIIKVVDDFVEEKTQQGRIIGYKEADPDVPNSHASIQLDRSITIKGGIRHKLVYYGLVGGEIKVIERQVLDMANDITTSGVYVFGDFVPPVPESIFLLSAIDGSIGSLWEIIGLSFDQESKEISVTGVEYNDALYTYMESPIDTTHLDIYTTAPKGIYAVPTQVKNIKIAATDPDVIADTLTVTWQWFYSPEVEAEYTAATARLSEEEKAKVAINNPITPTFEVHYRHTSSGNTYTTITNLTTMEVQVPILVEGTYEFDIFAISLRGVPSYAAHYTYTYKVSDLKKFEIIIKNIPSKQTRTKVVKLGRRYELEIIGANQPCKISLYKNSNTSKDIYITPDAGEYQGGFTVTQAEAGRIALEQIEPPTPTILKNANSTQLSPFFSIDIMDVDVGLIDIGTTPSRLSYINDTLPDLNSASDTKKYLNNLSTIAVTNLSMNQVHITVTLYVRILQA